MIWRKLGLFSIFLALASNAAVAQDSLEKARTTIREMRNSDIEWNLGTLGAISTYNKPIRERLEKLEESHSGMLINALLDPERFAVAHLVLCDLYANKIAFQNKDDDFLDTFHGLEVKFSKTGNTIYPDFQRHALRQEWRAKLAKLNW